MSAVLSTNQSKTDLLRSHASNIETDSYRHRVQQFHRSRANRASNAVKMPSFQKPCYETKGENRPIS